jgi:hypothetical protein
MSSPPWIGHCRICLRLEFATLCNVTVCGVPHGTPGHNVAYATFTLYACRHCGRAEIAFDDHDCWDVHETWDMSWRYFLDAPDGARLAELLEACPRPYDGSCDCPQHDSLRRSAEGFRGGIPSHEVHLVKSPAATVRLQVEDGRASLLPA